MNATNRQFKPEKEKEYRLYLIWKSLPSTFKKLGTKYLKELNINDEILEELIDIKTQRDFARKYKLREKTLSDWNTVIPPDEYKELD